MARSTLLLPLFLAALASAQEPARLDVVEMRSGERLTGHVVSQAGGMVEIRLGDGAVVRLRLSGRCQGCALAEVTVHQGIGPLLRALPGVAGVVDVTDHPAGTDPYRAPATR